MCFCGFNSTHLLSNAPAHAGRAAGTSGRVIIQRTDWLIVGKRVRISRVKRINRVVFFIVVVVYVIRSLGRRGELERFAVSRKPAFDLRPQDAENTGQNISRPEELMEF